MQISDRVVAVIAAFGLALVPVAAEAADPIAIGWVGPLSPPGGYEGGQEMKRGVELAVDDINKAGGVLGRPLKVIYEDTKGQPTEGSAGTIRLITKENVSAIIGEYHSSVGLAEIEEAHKYQVPWIGVQVWTDEVTSKHYPEVFRTSPTNALILTKVADFTAQHFKNVVVVAENTDFGLSGSKVLSEALGARKITNSVITIDTNQQDFTPTLLRLMKENPRPDVVEFIVAGPPLYRLVKQACQLGFAPNATTAIVGSVNLLQKDVWEVDGECAKHLLVLNPGLPKIRWNEKMKAFVTAFTDRFKRPPSTTAVGGYDTLCVVAAAIATAKSADPSSVIKGLEQVQYEGISGKYSFSNLKEPAWAYHQYMEVPLHIIQYTEMNQKPEDAPIVYPKEWATTDKILPLK